MAQQSELVLLIGHLNNRKFRSRPISVVFCFGLISPGYITLSSEHDYSGIYYFSE